MLALVTYRYFSDFQLRMIFNRVKPLHLRIRKTGLEVQSYHVQSKMTVWECIITEQVMFVA